MTVFVECAGPFQWRAQRFVSRVIVRYTWLWFAVGHLRVPFEEFATTAYEWKVEP